MRIPETQYNQHERRALCNVHQATTASKQYTQFQDKKANIK